MEKLAREKLHESFSPADESLPTKKSTVDSR